ncbi:MAG: DUF1844 domain-containing protein [Candidatus Eisenbacteria bacterium]|nr:DUF1844 domain-containing protein [Candidatus Eisenbacteria bacterium]
MSNDANQHENLFLQLIFTFEATAMQHMGKLISPLTNKAERNLEQARFSIDLLGMLEEKTRGNLTEQESRALTNVLYTLRINFLDELAKEKSGAEGTSQEESSKGESGSEG